MARIKDEKLHEERRLQILQAAANVFKTKGFHAARTEEICANAELSAGTVFRYFASKEEIIAAIVDVEIEEFRNHIRALGSKDGIKWIAQINAKELADLLAPSVFDLGADSWLELYRNPKYHDRMIEQDDELRAMLATVLREGQRGGWVRAELNAIGAANIIMGMFSGLMFDSQLNPTLNMTATAKALSDLFQCYILQMSE